MTEETTAALYPPPPPFYNFFTTENVTQYKQLLDDGKSKDEISEMKDIRFLVPPKKPEGETYRSFGDIWWFQDKIIGLKESGVLQLYDDRDAGVESLSEEDLLSPRRIEQLKKLTKSLLLNYLELVGLLAYNPTIVPKKVDEIRIILINIHHLLNSYRLHQSREAMIMNYQNKIKETWDDVEKIKSTCTNIKLKVETLKKLAEATLSETESGSGQEQDVVMTNGYVSVDEQLNLAKMEALDALFKSL